MVTVTRKRTIDSEWPYMNKKLKMSTGRYHGILQELREVSHNEIVRERCHNKQKKTIQPLILSYFPNNAYAIRILRTRCSWTIEGNAKRKKQIFNRVLISH